MEDEHGGFGRRRGGRSRRGRGYCGRSRRCCRDEENEWVPVQKLGRLVK